MTRRFLVFDGDGELVATFRTWEEAHAWAHQRATEPRTSLPVQLEDRLARRTWTMDDGGCRMTVWRRQVEYRYCSGPITADDVNEVVVDEIAPGRSARTHTRLHALPSSVAGVGVRHGVRLS